MPRSPGPSAFSDVAPFLDNFLMSEAETMTLNCGTQGKAVKTVQRMNQWRVRDRQMDHQRGGEGNSAYDAITIRRRDQFVILSRRAELAAIEAWLGDEKTGKKLDMDMFKNRLPTRHEQEIGQLPPIIDDIETS